jgi:hypothetical protein
VRLGREGQRPLEVLRAPHVLRVEPEAQRPCRCLRRVPHRGVGGIGRIPEDDHVGESGHDVLEEFQTFGAEFWIKNGSVANFKIEQPLSGSEEALSMPTRAALRAWVRRQAPPGPPGYSLVRGKGESYFTVSLKRLFPAESHEPLARRRTRYLKGESQLPNTRSPSGPVKNTGPERPDGPPSC